MNWYESKQEERRARLERAAETQERHARTRFQTARDILAPIPPGQPILVGHYSERRHRRALDRHDAAMRAACEAQEQAASLHARAAAVGSGGISSDDPDAPDKLSERIAELERERDLQKAVNAFMRKHASDTDAAVTARAFDLAREKFGAEVMKEVHTLLKHSWSSSPRRPFPAYHFANLSANLRRLKGRQTTIVASRNEEARAPITGIGWQITDEQEDNRITIRFDARISKDLVRALRAHGFVWARSSERWQRKRSDGAWYWAERICRGLRGDGTEASK